MELKDAQRQACQELGFKFEDIFRRGRPSLEQIAAKTKINQRASQLMNVPSVTATQVSQSEMVPVSKVRESKKRIAVPDGKPLHNCTFDVNLATVSMKVLEKSVPDFLKKRKLS